MQILLADESPVGSPTELLTGTMVRSRCEGKTEARSPAADDPLTQATDDDGQELEHPLHLRRGRRRAQG